MAELRTDRSASTSTLLGARFDLLGRPPELNPLAIGSACAVLDYASPTPRSRLETRIRNALGRSNTSSKIAGLSISSAKACHSVAAVCAGETPDPNLVAVRGHAHACHYDDPAVQLVLRPKSNDRFA